MNSSDSVKSTRKAPEQSQLSYALKRILVRIQTVFDFDGLPRRRRLVARLIVVALALIIIFIRMPIVFLHPAFWAEDAPLYFQLSYLDGWKAITTQTAGYLTLFQWLIGNLSTYFPVIAAPAIFNASAIALTLVVVWLVTSPRLPLPAKPLLALAVVTGPTAFEELGTLANSQWIFPIGAFSLLLMAPSKKQIISAAEILFIAIFSLTGPFSLLLLPVCGLQIILKRGDRAAQRRNLILTGIVVIGATIESVYLARNLANALPIDPHPITSSWQTWVVLPIAYITAPFHHVLFRTPTEPHAASLPIAIIAYGTIAYLAFREPYKAEKCSMLLFAFAIITLGMLKHRLVLHLTGMRYFYLAQVFSVWFFCCLPRTSKVREIFIGVVAMAMLVLVFAGANRPRIAEDAEWPVWSREIHSGLPVKIPAAPKGWFVTLPRDPNGPLTLFAAWEGKHLNHLALRRDDTLCAGGIERIESTAEATDEPQQIVRGWVKPSDHRHKIVVIVVTNPENRVVGFALPGFASGTGQESGWAGVAQYPTRDIGAVAIVVHSEEEAVCRLAGT